jgi:hypothetical protein
MNSSFRTPPLPTRLVLDFGAEASHRLGELFLANAIQAGLRLADGVKYRPLTQERLPSFQSSAGLRSKLRASLREFMAFLDQHPAASDLPFDAWYAISATERLWVDPLLSAEWAAALLPDRFDARLTQAVNLLRHGRARPALDQFQENLRQIPRAREPRAQLLRNAAAAYEVLGDDAGARWCARQSFAACPWSESSLASFLIYLALDAEVGDSLNEVGEACRAFRGDLNRPALWDLLDEHSGRASNRLQQDHTIRARFRQAVLH